MKAREVTFFGSMAAELLSASFVDDACLLALFGISPGCEQQLLHKLDLVFLLVLCSLIYSLKKCRILLLCVG